MMQGLTQQRMKQGSIVSHYMLWHYELLATANLVGSPDDTDLIIFSHRHRAHLKQESTQPLKFAVPVLTVAAL